MYLKVDDPIPLNDSDKANIDSIAGCWIDSDLNAAQKEILEETLQTLRRVFSITTTMTIEIGEGAATMSWIILIPEAFCKMVEERMPQALVLVAVYCVLLNRLDGFWWIKGKAENLLETIRKDLPDGWNKWLAWPTEEILIKKGV